MYNIWYKDQDDGNWYKVETFSYEAFLTVKAALSLAGHKVEQ